MPTHKGVHSPLNRGVACPRLRHVHVVTTACVVCSCRHEEPHDGMDGGVIGGIKMYSAMGGGTVAAMLSPHPHPPHDTPSHMTHRRMIVASSNSNILERR